MAVFHKNKRSPITRPVAAILAAALLLCGCFGQDRGSLELEDEEEASASLRIEDLTPATDFYGYVNARALMERSIPITSVSSSGMDDLNDLTQERIDGIIDEIAKGDAPYEMGSDEQLIHDAYRLCFDTAMGAIDSEAEDSAMVGEIISDISSAKSMDELIDVVGGMATKYGAQTLFASTVMNDLLDSDSNALCLEFQCRMNLENIMDSDRAAVLERDKLAETLRDLGVSKEEAEERATKVIYMLYDIAGRTDFDITNSKKALHESVEAVTAEDFSTAFGSGVTFSQLLSSVGLTDSSVKVYFKNPGQLRKVLSLLDESHLQEWKDFILDNFCVDNGDYFPKKYNPSADSPCSEKEAQEKASSFVQFMFQDEIAEIYVKKYFNEKTRQDITKMCEDIRDVNLILIERCEWLSDEGKRYLTDKLKTMQFFIGGAAPHPVNPADGRLIADSLMRTRFNIYANRCEKQRNRLTKKASRSGFDYALKPTEVNACYLPYLNSINVPIAILGGVAYDENAGEMENLGRIGSVIAHEISHAFDDKGVLYDAHGNFAPEAMPVDDRRAFDAIKEKCMDLYDRYTVLGAHVNGASTLGENLADLGAMQCCLAIAGSQSNQKIMLENYAKLWAGIYLDTEAKDLLKTDSHSPDRVRVNAVVSCFDEYYEIYGVKKGDPMFTRQRDRVRRW